jgi:hypothetical protein
MHDNDCNCEYCEFLRNPNREDGDFETLTDAQKALGGVSHMFIRRRMKDPRFRFPEVQRLGRFVRIYRRHRELWMRSPHARMRAPWSV